MLELIHYENRRPFLDERLLLMPDLKLPHVPSYYISVVYSTSPETPEGIKSSTFKMLIYNVVPVLKKKTFFMLNAFLCTQKQ